MDYRKTSPKMPTANRPRNGIDDSARPIDLERSDPRLFIDLPDQPQLINHIGSEIGIIDTTNDSKISPAIDYTPGVSGSDSRIHKSKSRTSQITDDDKQINKPT